VPAYVRIRLSVISVQSHRKSIDLVSSSKSRQKWLSLLQEEISLELLAEISEMKLGSDVSSHIAVQSYTHNVTRDKVLRARKTKKLKDSSTEISTGSDNLEITDSREIVRPSLLTSRIIFLKTSNYISLSSEIGCKTKFRVRLRSEI